MARVGIARASWSLGAVLALCGDGVWWRGNPRPRPHRPTLAAGALHSLAIDATGSVWAWGANVGFQVGDGTTQMRTAPVRLTTLTGTFTTVAAGGAHSLARRADGAVFGSRTQTRATVFSRGVTQADKNRHYQLTRSVPKAGSVPFRALGSGLACQPRAEGRGFSLHVGRTV